MHPSLPPSRLSPWLKIENLADEEGAGGGGSGVLLVGQEIPPSQFRSRCLGTVSSLRGVTEFGAETGQPPLTRMELIQSTVKSLLPRKKSRSRGSGRTHTGGRAGGAVRGAAWSTAATSRSSSSTSSRSASSGTVRSGSKRARGGAGGGDDAFPDDGGMEEGERRPQRVRSWGAGTDVAAVDAERAAAIDVANKTMSTSFLSLSSPSSCSSSASSSSSACPRSSAADPTAEAATSGSPVSTHGASQEVRSTECGRKPSLCGVVCVYVSPRPRI